MLKLISVLFVFLISFKAFAGGCFVALSDARKVIEKAIFTSYNIFPIKVGGFTVLSWADMPSFKSISGLPVCVCLRGGVPVPGIKISMHRPKALVDVVKDPFCSPTLGIQLPKVFGYKKSIGANNIGTLNGDDFYTYELHYFKFPLFAMLNKLTDTGCFNTDPDVMLVNMTEMNPIWHNDKYYALLHPIVFLLAHPISQMACIADCAKASYSVGIRELFWCSGCWGSVFPATKNMITSDNPSAAGLAIHRLIQNLHEPPFFELKQEVGNSALCQSYPTAIPDKRQYSVFPIYPTVYPRRIPLGRTSLKWSSMLDIPLKNMHNWVWVIYSKRDCCAL